MERWRTVTGSMDEYSVSDEGRIRNNRTGHILKTYRTKHNVELVFLAGRFNRSYTVASLVGKAFVGGKRFRHKDGDPFNNRADNLYCDDIWGK